MEVYKNYKSLSRPPQSSCFSKTSRELYIAIAAAKQNKKLIVQRATIKYMDGNVNLRSICFAIFPVVFLKKNPHPKFLSSFQVSTRGLNYATSYFRGSLKKMFIRLNIYLAVFIAFCEILSLTLAFKK